MLNENIKNARKAKGFSQEELAIKLNVVRQTVSKWEKGLSVPDSEMLIKIAEELDTSPSMLLDEAAIYDKKSEIEILSSKLEVLNEQFARKTENTRKGWQTFFATLGISSACIFIFKIIYIIFSYFLIVEDLSMIIFNTSGSLITSLSISLICFIGLYKSRNSSKTEPSKSTHKRVLMHVGLFILNFLPLVMSVFFRFGFVSNIFSLIVMFIPLFFNYNTISKPITLIFYNIALIFTTSITQYFITQLYINYVTGLYDYGTIIIGRIEFIVAILLTGIASIISTALKIHRNSINNH